MTDLRHTPFHAQHSDLGARFVPFAGYELPVQFAGVVAEHEAVRDRAGVFDVSHMGEILVEGPQALAAVQWIVTNDLSRLEDGRALYTVMCRAHGGIVDDLIVYRLAADRYFLCINGARRDADRMHITSEAERFDCRVTDVSDDWAQLAVQGPRADAIVGQLTSHDLAGMAPFTFADVEVGGVSGVRLARTGYTGESGCELYVKNDGAADLWHALMEAGVEHGLSACGLGARDTLRLEMKYPLYGNDIDEEHNPIEAGLGWVVKLKKGSFLGRDTLREQKRQGPARRWVGFKMLQRGIPRQGYPILVAGHEVGVVTSGTHSPSLGEPIGCGYVPAAAAAVGTEIEVVIRDRPVAARVVETPFYKRDQA
jgi:aminomethyltransferase